MLIFAASAARYTALAASVERELEEVGVDADAVVEGAEDHEGLRIDRETLVRSRGADEDRVKMPPPQLPAKAAAATAAPGGEEAQEAEPAKGGEGDAGGGGGDGSGDESEGEPLPVDDDLDQFLLSPEESARKRAMWEMENGDWEKAQAEREAADPGASARRRARRKRRKKMAGRGERHAAATAAEAMQNVGGECVGGVRGCVRACGCAHTHAHTRLCRWQSTSG